MNTKIPADLCGNMGRLRWRCRRGMRELDEAMQAYLNHHYTQASAEEQSRFEELIDMQDPELFGLISGKSKEARYQTIINQIGTTLKVASAKGG
jgi:antitoxin CptB